MQRDMQFVNWLLGSLEGGLQGGVARFASEQRLLTKWTAVDQSCGTTPRKHKIAAVDDESTTRGPPSCFFDLTCVDVGSNIPPKNSIDVRCMPGRMVLYMFRVVSLALAVATWQYHVCDAAITQTISAGSLITVDVAVYDASSGGVSQCVLSPHARSNVRQHLVHPLAHSVECGWCHAMNTLHCTCSQRCHNQRC